MKKLFIIAIIWALTFAIIRIEKKFKREHFFDITKIEISPVSSNLGKSLEDVKKSLMGENIHDIDIDKVKERILSDIRVSSVDIFEKDINELRIEVKERKAVYYIQYNDKIYNADESGVIFGELDEYPKKSIPILVLKDEKNKDQLIEIISKLNETDFKDEVSQIYFVNDKMIVILLRDGVEIKTNAEVQKSKYLITFNLYRELRKTKEIEYMDIRFNDIIVKEKEGKNAGKHQ